MKPEHSVSILKIPKFSDYINVLEHFQFICKFKICNKFQDFQAPRLFSRTFQVLENSAVKFKEFKGLLQTVET